MEHQEILSLLHEANDSKFVTKKMNIVNDQSYGKHGERNEIIYNTDVLKSDLSGYNDATFQEEVILLSQQLLHHK